MQYKCAFFYPPCLKNGGYGNILSVRASVRQSRVRSQRWLMGSFRNLRTASGNFLGRCPSFWNFEKIQIGRLAAQKQLKIGLFHVAGVRSQRWLMGYFPNLRTASDKFLGRCTSFRNFEKNQIGRLAPQKQLKIGLFHVSRVRSQRWIMGSFRNLRTASDNYLGRCTSFRNLEKIQDGCLAPPKQLKIGLFHVSGVRSQKWLMGSFRNLRTASGNLHGGSEFANLFQ